MPDEQLAGRGRVDGGIAHPSARYERKSVERHPFEGHHGTAFSVPVRLAVAALHQMSGHPLDHLGFDAGGDAAVEAAGLHEVGDHQPAWRPFGQHRPGSQHESGVARTGVLARIPPLPQTDMREQAGNQAACTRAGSAGSGSSDSRIPISRAMLRSCPVRSCHSRMRR